MSSLSRLVRMLMLALVLGLASARPATAADEGPSILRDAETEALFRDIAAPLVEAANLDNKSVRVVLLRDDEINAFVAGSQNVYVNSGLLTTSDNVNQLQAVIAHELGHVAGGHAIRMGEGAKEATGISLATMVLGAIAIAAGAPEAGMGLLAMGQRAALGSFLAFTRAQETSADLAGAKYLSAAGISGKGSLEFFKKLQNQEYRLAIYSTDSYERTHPLSSERISILENLYKKDPAWDRPSDPQLEARFQRVKAKLFGFVNSRQAINKYPESDQTVPAHYARAYAYHLGAYPEKALSEAEALLKTNPHDPYFLELKGQILAIDQARQEITVSHADIPGFMPAMTMPYKVRDVNLLKGRTPGELIGATLVVEESDAYLQSIRHERSTRNASERSIQITFGEERKRSRWRKLAIASPMSTRRRSM